MISYKLNIQIFSIMYSAAITPSDTLNTQNVSTTLKSSWESNFGITLMMILVILKFLVMPYIAF